MHKKAIAIYEYLEAARCRSASIDGEGFDEVGRYIDLAIASLPPDTSRATIKARDNRR